MIPNLRAVVRLGSVGFAACVAAACGTDTSAGDAGPDVELADASPADAAADAPTDASRGDADAGAGSVDGGVDAIPSDAGIDAEGSDASPSDGGAEDAAADIVPSDGGDADAPADVATDAATDASADAGPAVEPLPDPVGTRQRATWVGARGVREFVRYTPSTPAPATGRGVILALHGCDQTADVFLDGSRLEALAEREGAIVIAPEQPAIANPLRCWNWFVPANQTRLLGEGAQLVELLDDVTEDVAIDAASVHVTGISAGGSMAAILLACHPERFASGMVVAGVPYAAASDPLTAAGVMASGPAVDPVTLGDLAHVCGGRQSLAPRVLVLHGTDDDVVSPRNGDAIIEQFARVHDHVDDGVTGDPPRLSSSVPPRGLGDPSTTWTAVDEPSPRLGSVRVEGLGHAWPGGDGRYAYATSGGPSATQWAGWWFFGR